MGEITSRDKVLSVHMDAWIRKEGKRFGVFIGKVQQINCGIYIGSGATEAEAWDDAANQLPSAPSPAEETASERIWDRISRVAEQTKDIPRWKRGLGVNKRALPEPVSPEVIHVPRIPGTVNTPAGPMIPAPVSPEGAAEPSPEVGQVWRAPDGTQYRVIQFLGTPGRWLFQCVSDRTLGTATLDSTWELIPQPPAPEAAAAGEEYTVDTHKLGTCLRFANGETCIGCGDKKNGEPLPVAAPTAPAADGLTYDDCTLADAQAAEQWAVSYVCKVGVSRETMIDAISTLRAQVLTYARAEEYRKGAKNV